MNGRIDTPMTSPANPARLSGSTLPFELALKGAIVTGSWSGSLAGVAASRSETCPVVPVDIEILAKH